MKNLCFETMRFTIHILHMKYNGFERIQGLQAVLGSGLL